MGLPSLLSALQRQHSPGLCTSQSTLSIPTSICSCACWVVYEFLTPWAIAPPGFPVCGIFQARMLEWVAISYSRGSSWPRDWTPSLESPAMADSSPVKPPHLYTGSQIYISSHTDDFEPGTQISSCFLHNCHHTDMLRYLKFNLFEDKLNFLAQQTYSSFQSPDLSHSISNH